MVEVSITHLRVPMQAEGADNRKRMSACLDADGSAAHVTRTLKMIDGRWKLAVLFRLFAASSLRSSQLLKDIANVSQKMLTQTLRELENDRLILRRDFGQQPPRVEYALTASGRELIPVLRAMRDFSRQHEKEGLISIR